MQISTNGAIKSLSLPDHWLKKDDIHKNVNQMSHTFRKTIESTLIGFKHKDDQRITFTIFFSGFIFYGHRAERIVRLIFEEGSSEKLRDRMEPMSIHRIPRVCDYRSISLARFGDCRAALVETDLSPAAELGLEVYFDIFGNCSVIYCAIYEAPTEIFPRYRDEISEILKSIAWTEEFNPTEKLTSSVESSPV